MTAIDSSNWRKFNNSRSKKRFDYFAVTIRIIKLRWNIQPENGSLVTFLLSGWWVWAVRNECIQIYMDDLQAEILSCKYILFACWCQCSYPQYLPPHADNINIQITITETIHDKETDLVVYVFVEMNVSGSTMPAQTYNKCYFVIHIVCAPLSPHEPP